ncbi:MAG: anthranilate synthase component I, partial [Planctomycetota bacterium]
MRYAPDFDTFAKLADEGYARIPVHRRLLGDALTPVSAFARVRGNGHAFLLESVVGGERVGRHSFIAFDPVDVYEPGAGTTDPLAELQARIGDERFWRDPALPSFTGGAVGFAGYDLMRFYEPEKLAEAPTDDRGLPDVHFGIYDRLLIFDHVDKTVRAVANARIDGDVRAAYDA